MAPLKDNPRDERGVAILYVALFLLPSLWLASLAIDMGKLTVTKNELQRAADAAALAGASCVDPNNGSLVQDSARVRAAYVASQNTALQTKSEAVVIDPQNDISFPTANKIKVTVHRDDASGNPMTTIFAQTLGITSLNVHTYAIAEAIPSEPCEKTTPMAPVQIPGGYSTDCGSSYDLKVASGGKNPSPGNFQLLDFGTDCNEGPCAGLSGIGPLTECWIKNGYGCCLKIGDSFVMLGEAGGEWKPMPCMLHLYVRDTDAMYASAMKAGATSLRGPADQFYGDRSAGVQDAAGNHWWIHTHIEDVSAEELERRMAKQGQG